ncbi:MAG TPA: acyltransferase [Chthonomonas sp.]|uniref:acyltransferase family protein n=1 Tax=Chthonomonas sp. TaxID=2282153 RepID=UPI002B4B058F|nr:acyltransferase [Chthonomonas sp.]HLI49126.1 acyltransferase [Chthonomonas sp.]
MTTVSAPVRQEPVLATEAPRLRLEFLDGLRGMAALYVATSHAMLYYYIATDNEKLFVNPIIRKILKLAYFTLLSFGHEAVVIFIVLSGYVLMLPIARTQDGHMPKGMWDYFKRRARRILPPYYAALLLVSLLLLIFPRMNMKFHSFWDLSVPVHTLPQIISHVFLVHNFSGEWQTKFDSPMWSIAVEWQIYFWFPLLLLPLWKRFGITVMILFAWAFGLCGYYFHFGGTYSWLIGDFAFGVAAAIIGFWNAPRTNALRKRFHWYKLAIVFGSLAYLFLVDQRRFVEHNPHLRLFVVTNWHLGKGCEFPIDLLVGLAASCFIIGSTYHLQQGLPDNQLLRFLHRREVIFLGTFSYSLYLIHVPCLAIMDKIGRILHLTGNLFTIELFLAGLPLCIVLAYLFHLVFERPFMPTHLRKGQAKSLEQSLSESKS